MGLLESEKEGMIVMAIVETTIKIDDCYLKRIEEEAEKEGSSIAEFIRTL